MTGSWTALVTTLSGCRADTTGAWCGVKIVFNAGADKATPLRRRGVARRRYDPRVGCQQGFPATRNKAVHGKAVYPTILLVYNGLNAVTLGATRKGSSQAAGLTTRQSSCATVMRWSCKSVTLSSTTAELRLTTVAYRTKRIGERRTAPVAFCTADARVRTCQHVSLADCP